MSVYADLAAWLDGLGWPWFLFGGQAALVHGGTRVTADVDVTVVGDLASLGALEASVPQTFARRADRAFTERTLVLPVLHTGSGVPVDVVLGATRFEAEVASRAETTMIAATSMRVIAAEDLVVLKLLAGRPHDLLDAAAVCAARPALDEAAVRARVGAFAEALEDPEILRRLEALWADGAPRAAVIALRPAGVVRPTTPGRSTTKVTKAAKATKATKVTKAHEMAARAVEVPQVLTLRVTLRDTRPVVWRTVRIAAESTFWALHVALQDAMGWQDAHLHAFRPAKPPRRGGRPTPYYGIPDEDDFPGAVDILPGWEHPVSEYLRKVGDSCVYDYDFGDGWEHTVEVAAVEPRSPEVRLPECIGGARACPPEDCGGPPGYATIVAGDVDDDLREWLGNYDPAMFSAARVRFRDPARALKAMLRR